ncbi:MAG: TatD family hydrolase [Balneolaceae bacterium]
MTLQLIDTHCHLYLDEFSGDLKEVCGRALQKGVTRILLPAISSVSLEQMNRLSHPGICFYKMAGIHPCEISEKIQADEEQLYKTAARDSIIAIGETGLDYYWSRDWIDDQKRSLKIHCAVAKALDKPIVLHNRESTSDLLDLIEEEQDGSLKGVWHCFTGTPEEGKRAIGLGLALGIGGVLTFKNSGVANAVRELPLESMVLETDAPYLAPVPKRGKRNEPSFVAYTAERLAEVMDLPVEEIAEITSRNAEELFGIQVKGNREEGTGNR